MAASHAPCALFDFFTHSKSSTSKNVVTIMRDHVEEPKTNYESVVDLSCSSCRSFPFGVGGARNVEQVVSVGEDVAGSEPMRSSACVATAESERGRRST
jgi:hypothetical protein